MWIISRDDYELGNNLAGAGNRVELSRFPVSIGLSPANARASFSPPTSLEFEHSVFAAMGNHFGLMFTQGLPWAILGAVLARTPAGAVGYIAAYLIFRITMAAVVAGSTAMGDILVLKQIWLLPLRDAFAFIVWLASFFPQRIHWRDSEFYVRNKRLVPAPRRSPS